MAIGTSLGAYFESDFHHQAGIETPPEVVKPGDTGDDNILPETPDTSGITIRPVSDVKPDYNYDAWKSATGLESLPEGQHYPDTFKLPNHMTFSNDSIYHGRDGNEGGQWTKIENDPDHDWSFTPGTTNFQNHSLAEMKDYFAKVEPKSQLIIPDTAAGMAAGASEKAADALKRGQGSSLPDFTEDRPRDFLERSVLGMFHAAHNVMSGKVPMWAMDPETGEFHTSPEGIEAGLGMLPAAGSGTGFARIHLRGDVHDALPEIAPDRRLEDMPHLQEALRRIRRQPSNIEPDQPPTYEPHYPVIESDAEFLRRVRQQPNDWQQQPWRDEDFHGTEADLVHDLPDRPTVSQKRIEEAKAKFVDNPTLRTKGPVSLVRDPEGKGYGGPNRHHFNFMSEGGVPGDLTIQTKRQGKELHVSWIGTVGGNGANEVGKSEMKNLFRLLADEFPKAEEITGFRVSGARAATGRIGDAGMKIPGRGGPRRPEPQRKTIQQLDQEFRQPSSFSSGLFNDILDAGGVRNPE